jgi:hypothetical protein
MDLRESIASLHYQAFLSTLAYKSPDGQWVSPRNAEEALRSRREIMSNYNWDVSWMQLEEDWESYYGEDVEGGKFWNALSAPDFGEFPKVPLWVEIFGNIINDCSEQTHQVLSDECQIIFPIFKGFLEGEFDPIEYACLLDPDAGLEYQDYFQELINRRNSAAF